MAVQPGADSGMTIVLPAGPLASAHPLNPGKRRRRARTGLEGRHRQALILRGSHRTATTTPASSGRWWRPIGPGEAGGSLDAGTTAPCHPAAVPGIRQLPAVSNWCVDAIAGDIAASRLIGVGGVRLYADCGSDYQNRMERNGAAALARGKPTSDSLATSLGAGAQAWCLCPLPLPSCPTMHWCNCYTRLARGACRRGVRRDPAPGGISTTMCSHAGGGGLNRQGEMRRRMGL